MKKNVLYLAALGLLGCVSTPHSPPDMASTPHQPAVIYLKEGDRNPAQAPDLRWNPALIPLEIHGNLEQRSVVAQVNQEMTWVEEEAFNDVRMEYQETLVPTTCAELSCSAGRGGNSALWNQYFSAPGGQKAHALANAINGVGDVSAQALVSNGYFKSKPRSWDDFSSEIQRAANAGVIKKSVATEVIYNHRMENAMALGYDQNSCREVVRNCSVWMDRLVAVPFLNKRLVTRKRVMQSKMFNVDIQVKGAKLLPFEKDTLQVAINEDGRMLENDGAGGLNRYTFTNSLDERGHVLIEGTAVSRLQRDLPSNVIRKDSYQLVGGKANFLLEVDPAYIPGQEDPDAQLVVDYTVNACKYGSFLGTCAGVPWAPVKVSSQQIKDPTGRVLIETDVPVYNKGEIVYTVTRRNSQYFSNKPTNPRETDTVKMPKQ